MSGHFTVTLACSLLAEAAQATTPPIPLLVAPAQGLPQLQLQVARVAATASAVIGGRREVNGGRAGGNGDGCSSVPGRKGGKSSIDTGSHGGGNARRCGERCGCARSCAATRSLREPLRSLRAIRTRGRELKACSTRHWSMYQLKLHGVIVGSCSKSASKYALSRQSAPELRLHRRAERGVERQHVPLRTRESRGTIAEQREQIGAPNFLLVELLEPCCVKPELAAPEPRTIAWALQRRGPARKGRRWRARSAGRHATASADWSASIASRLGASAGYS